MSKRWLVFLISEQLPGKFRSERSERSTRRSRARMLRRLGASGPMSPTGGIEESSLLLDFEMKPPPIKEAMWC